MKKNINRVIIDSIILKNFMTFDDYKIEGLSKNNIIIITGKNANGKSTLTSETINYGLFGRPLRYNKISDLISWEMPKGATSSVEMGLVFEKDNEKSNINIKRILSENNRFEITSDNESCEVFNLLKNDIKIADFTKHIKDILDIDEKKFNMIYLKSPFSEVLFESNSELLSSITKSQYINELRKDFSDIVKNLNNDKSTLIDSITNQKTLIASINKEINESKEEINVEDYKKRIDEIKLKIEKLNDELSNLNKNINEKRVALKEYNEKIRQAQNYISNKNAEVNSLYRKKREIEELVNAGVCIKCKQPVKMASYQSEMDEINNSLTEFEEQLNKALKYKEKIESYYNKLDNELDNFISNKDKFNSQIYQLNNIKSDLSLNIELSKKEKKNNDSVLKKIQETINDYNTSLKELSRDHVILDSICKVMLNKNSEYINKFYNSKIYDFTLIFKSILSKLTNGKFNEISIKLNNKPTINGHIEYNALSSSERKFVDIAFVISYIVYLSKEMKFKCFILDEFFDTFDAHNIVHIYEIIDELSKTYNLQIIITSNMSELVMSYLADTVSIRTIDITK